MSFLHMIEKCHKDPVSAADFNCGWSIIPFLTQLSATGNFAETEVKQPKDNEKTGTAAA